MYQDLRITIAKNKIAGLANRSSSGLQAPCSQQDLDSIIELLTSLTDDLASCLEQQQEQKNKINSLLDVLVKYTMMDFSVKSKITDKGDEIDALGAGLNALGEELQFSTGRLKESEEKLHAIIANAPDAIVTFNSAGIITTWNPAAQTIFGWSENEVMGKPVSEVIIPEEYKKRYLKDITTLLKAGKGPDSNKTLYLPALCKDHSIIDVELTISPTKLKDDHIFIAFLRNITERKKTEEAIINLNKSLEQRVLERTQALHRSEQKYRHLFENSPLPMWLFELPSYRFIDVNEAAIQHYGYTREEFLSMTALDIRPDDEKDRYRQLPHPTNTGTKNMGIWKHLKKDGAVIQVEVSVHDIEYNGKIARLVVSNDISEKIRAEELLRYSEARFRRIYDANMMGFIFWDASGEIVDTNDFFLQLLGYSREDLQQGRLKWSAITPPEYAELDKVALEQIAVSGTCQPYEKEYIRKDGARVSVLLGAASIDEEAREKGVAYVMDINQRKAMEEEIRELNRDLEKRVQMRTEQLELVNKELESFSYSVSHDLRAPLRAIHGFSEILLEDYSEALDDAGKRLINIVMKNARKMGTLIDELLEFSRLGKKEIRKSLVDLDKVVADVIKETTGTLPHPSILIPQPLGLVNADHTLIKLVYQNLILNAIKYTSKKEKPEILIGVQDVEGTRTYYVKDNGAGFDMTYYNKLFGVFQRLHRQEEFEGVGVGLATVQRIITRHEGKIWAEGIPNQGATFYFTLEN